MELVYIGIDPGKTGALAVLDGAGVPLLVEDVPYTGSDVNVVQIAEWLLPFKGAARAAIERQQVYPAQGAVSGFTIGYGYGMLIGLLTGLAIPFESPRPRVWRHGLSIPDGADKSVSILTARRLFPGADLRGSPRKRKDSDGRAEALLIAEWRRRIG